MRKALLLTAATAVAIAATAGDGLDLLSSARLRKARAEARKLPAVTAVTTALNGNGISSVASAWYLSIQPTSWRATKPYAP